MGATVRIVLDTLYAARNPIFIPLKIDDSIMALMTATSMARRNSTVIITPTRIGFWR